MSNWTCCSRKCSLVTCFWVDISFVGILQIRHFGSVCKEAGGHDLCEYWWQKKGQRRVWETEFKLLDVKLKIRTHLYELYLYSGSAHRMKQKRGKFTAWMENVIGKRNSEYLGVTGLRELCGIYTIDMSNGHAHVGYDD